MLVLTVGSTSPTKMSVKFLQQLVNHHCNRVFVVLLCFNAAAECFSANLAMGDISIGWC